ncbi:MAG: hypothetical protein HOW97_43410 [Catenulispora sp.]|nr:hypothetical protein [Catenulispora sp.]
MDANPHAAGGEPDDDVFGPVEDGEEVFEWIDDDTQTDDRPGAAAPRPPAPACGNGWPPPAPRSPG